MREFFIRSLEIVVNIVVVLLSIGVVISALGVMFSGIHATGADGSQVSISGPLAGLGILLFGAIYICILGGTLYLGLGIYHNTKRTAEAVERLAQR